jgi:cytochrome P450
VLRSLIVGSFICLRQHGFLSGLTQRPDVIVRSAALSSFAEARSAIIAHPGYLGNAIQETLRYDPPIQNTRRL